MDENTSENMNVNENKNASKDVNENVSVNSPRRHQTSNLVTTLLTSALRLNRKFGIKGSAKTREQSPTHYQTHRPGTHPPIIGLVGMSGVRVSVGAPVTFSLFTPISSGKGLGGRGA